MFFSLAICPESGLLTRSRLKWTMKKKKRIFTFNPTYLIILSYLRMAHDIIHHKVPGIRWNFSFSMEQRENIHLYSIKNMFKGWSYLYLHIFLNTFFFLLFLVFLISPNFNEFFAVFREGKSLPYSFKIRLFSNKMKLSSKLK